MAAVLLLGLVPYLFATGNGAVLDDAAVAWGNPAVKAPSGSAVWELPFVSGAEDSPWRPLATWSFRWNYRGENLQRSTYYLTQVIFRCAGAGLLFLLLLKLTRHKIISALWALLAWVHPGSSEAVFRLAGRGAVLGYAFFLIAVMAYVSSWREQGRTDSAGGLTGGVRSVILWAAYAMALASSGETWILPVVLVAGELIRARVLGRPFPWRTLPDLAPLLLLLGGWRILAAGADSGGGEPASLVPWLNPLARVGDSVALVFTYLRLFAAPLDLSTNYVHILGSGGIAKVPYLVLGAAVTGALAWGMVVALMKRMTLEAWGISWWFLGLLPCLPIMGGSGPFASEMCLLVPSTGLVLTLASLMARWAAVPRRGLPTAAVLGVLCVLFGVRTAVRAADFRANDLLLHKQLSDHPGNAEFLFQRGNRALSASDWREAQNDYIEATDRLGVDPRYWINLGIAFHAQENYSLAVRSYRSAAEILERRDDSPDLIYKVHYHLGMALSKQGNKAEAAQSLERAIAVRPRSLPALVQLGLAYSQNVETYSRALAVLQRAVALERDPEKAENIQDVIDQLEEAIAATPRRD
jgi:tetratricopeptide (TPR) repeat protein